MKHGIIFLAVLATALLANNVYGENLAEDNGGDQIAYLAIDGNEHEMLLGKTSRIKIGDRQFAVKIRLAPFRFFNKGGIQFNFPSLMHYKLDDADPNVKMWNINGDNALIMIQAFRMHVDHTALINAFKDQYTQMKADVDLSAIKLKTAGTIFKGTRFDITMGNIRLYQEVYIIEKDSRTTAIILQDAPDEGNNNTGEYMHMKKIFAESFLLQ